MHHCFANQAETDGLPSLFSTTKTLKSQLWPHASSNFRNPCCVAPCTIHISHQIPNQQTSCSQPVLLSLLTDHHHRIQFISSSVCKMNISTLISFRASMLNLKQHYDTNASSQCSQMLHFIHLRCNPPEVFSLVNSTRSGNELFIQKISERMLPASSLNLVS